MRVSGSGAGFGGQSPKKRDMRKAKKGETFAGTVAKKDDSGVVLVLGDGSSILAKIDESAFNKSALRVGMSLRFEVKENDSGRVSVKIVTHDKDGRRLPFDIKA